MNSNFPVLVIAYVLRARWRYHGNSSSKRKLSNLTPDASNSLLISNTRVNCLNISNHRERSPPIMFLKGTGPTGGEGALATRKNNPVTGIKWLKTKQVKCNNNFKI